MARIRTIKPDFWKSEAIAMHPHRTRLTFIGLWTYVDDNGVGLDNEKLITAELYPLEDDPREALANVREDLARLAASGRIARYTVVGKRYLSITNWTEHQKIDRPGKPRYPTPDKADPEPVTSENTTDMASRALALVQPSRDTREALATVHLLEQGTGNREQGPLSSSEPAAPDPDDNQDDVATHQDPEPPREDVELVCRHLADKIHENRRAAGSKKPRPNITQKWRDAARRLIDLDKCTVPEILAAIDWCQQDEFWATNIESMPTLRKQYDRLRLDAIRRPAGHTVPKPRSNPLDDRKAALQRSMARAQAKMAARKAMGE